MPQLIGLCGRAGAGKDYVCERLRGLGDQRGIIVERLSFADPLKDSVCALFDITREQLEEWKNTPDPFLNTYRAREDGGHQYMSMRYLLQRYGTEAHRDIFGENFWVEETMWKSHKSKADIVVFTDVRFPNEAEAIQEEGQVFEIVGPEGPMPTEGDHVSALRTFEVDGQVDNTLHADIDDDLMSFFRESHVPVQDRGR